MIYIVALGGGFKCPRKIHLNTQCPTSFSAHTSIESPFKLMEISWHENENRVIAKSCGTLYNLQLLFFLQIQKQFLESVLDMNLKMEVILIISILLSLMFAINSGQKNIWLFSSYLSYKLAEKFFPYPFRLFRNLAETL